MSELALELIAENKKTKATFLDLGNCGLTEIPEEIGELVWLEKLNFSSAWFDWTGERWLRHPPRRKGDKNKIDTLSIVLAKLQRLKFLIFNENPVTDLAPVAQLANLKYFSCDDTPVSDLAALSQLTNLQVLSFENTKVRDLTALSQLTNLQALHCPDTQISDLTPLTRLNNLHTFSCGNTKVRDLTPLTRLNNLQALYCHNTQVSDLTPLSQLTNLQTLYCIKTKVNDLTPLLHLIKKRVPVKWAIHEDGICVQGCPLTTPSPEIVKQGNEAILRYFEEMETARQSGTVIRLAEAKCLLLGEGGAGKTSLARKLLDQNNPLPEEKETTKGIVVHPLELRLADGTEFRLNLWDFGGQEIYHATHQFFLTKRSLYLLLDDTRKDDRTLHDPVFNYWLQVAELYSGNSPLIIVQNEKGDRSKPLDLQGMQGRFGFVKDSKAVNLATCRGLADVQAAIDYWVRQLPHTGEEQPKVWLDIRRELERMAREDKRDHISLEEYYAVCKGFGMPERDRALFLSGYLHDFGAFLHFQEDPLLRKMLVLNNQWATDGVYRVLDDEPVKKHIGRFTRRDLTRLWHEDCYAEQHGELLALMMKFELCYQLPGAEEATWLAPQLLPVTRPEAFAWEDAHNLQLRYEYAFLPKGLLSRHIVRMHRYLPQPELAWHSGVLLERENSRALVTETYGSREIVVRARGPHAKELLTLIAEDFDLMHARFEGLQVRKMIPCNCRICGSSEKPHFYEHEDLMTRKTKGKSTVECRVSYDYVPVAGLLEGIFAKVSVNESRERKKGDARPLKVFISYSKDDRKKFLKPLIEYLHPLQRSGLLETWDDSQIPPGEEWDESIKTQIEAADVIFLLVSAHSLRTDYIWNVEIAAAMRRHAEGTAHVIPIILSKCLWKEKDPENNHIFPPASLNAVPQKGKPVDEWTRRNDAWDDVVDGIRAILKNRTSAPT